MQAITQNRTKAIRQSVGKRFYQAIPSAPVASVAEWGREHVRLVGSALSEQFDPDSTPWIKEPLECAHVDSGVQKWTFVKPIQGGGSVAGEVAICYWISEIPHGDILYNWQNDDASDGRWLERFEPILKACPKVMERAPKDRYKWTKGRVRFPTRNFIMQGVLSARNVASRSIRFEMNEELHDVENGWVPGRLEQAYGRVTAFWNHKIGNISNAGRKGDQLHQAFQAGTRQEWEVPCPGCGQFHPMRCYFDKRTPELGGLRYDASARNDLGEPDYTRLEPTIRYQMPCGYQFPDDLTLRRRLSKGGKYSPPAPGTDPKERSYTLQAVAVDYIPWITLIKQKHKALRALKLGDPKDWFDYKRERECQFIDPMEDRPAVHRIELSDRKKDREGLPNRVARFGALDRQHGEMAQGEMPHWWGMIQDVAESNGKIHVLTVFEGKLVTDEDAAEVMHRHGVPPAAVCVDSGDDTTHVYQFCLKHGFDAIKGSGEALFAHPDGGKRIFSLERPLHLMLNQPPSRDDPGDEPQFWFYSKAGIRERLAWLRSSDSVLYEVPSDVSEDFTKHFNAEERRSRQSPRTGETIHEWVQVSRRNDLFVCACYCAVQMERAGIIGSVTNESAIPS